MIHLFPCHSLYYTQQQKTSLCKARAIEPTIERKKKQHAILIKYDWWKEKKKFNSESSEKEIERNKEKLKNDYLFYSIVAADYI